MELTSGGTPGPRIRDDLAGLDGNLYGMLTDPPPVAALAEAFVGAGWRARASSFTEVEVECTWAELTLAPHRPGETLVSGIVDPACLDDLAGVLAGFGLRYSIELWDGTTHLRTRTG